MQIQEVEIGAVVTVVWNTVVFAAAAWMLWAKIDKRLAIMEDRIHNNGFASKVDVNRHEAEIGVVRHQIANLSTRVSITERVCALEHGRHDPYAEEGGV